MRFTYIPQMRQWKTAILGLVALLILAASPAYAQSVSQVTVRGNQRVESETIKAYVTLRPGQPYSAAKVDESLKALFSTGLFADVDINNNGSVVVVTVVENAIIDRIAFEGNKKNDDADLAKEIQSRSGSAYTRAKAEADAQRIIDVYRRQGRYDIKVEPKIIELPSSRVNLVFEINEGEKTKVEKITFIGNQEFSDYRLRDVITTTESNWLSFLKSSDVYDPERLSVDQELLRRYYLKNGYADFKVISAVADYDRAKNAFFITFTVDEGQQYRFGAINIESSIASINGDEYRSYLKSKQGEIYNAEKVDKSLEAVGVAIAKKGYPFAQVRPRGDRDPANSVINITYVIEDGPRLYVERININNNNRTQDRVIRREIDIAEGDAYNRVFSDRAEKRLNAMGYFKKVNIAREQGSAPDRVVLNVDVEEQSTGDLSFGAGYATNDGVIADVGITERNFLGRGQIVKASLGVGTRRQKAELSFTEPFFLDRRLALGFDAFYRKSESNSTSSFEQEVYGGGTRLGITLTEELSAQLRLSAYEQRVRVPAELQDCTFPFPGPPGANPDADADGTIDCLENGEASLAIRQSQGDSFVALVGGTLVYNRLDNVRNPREGYFAQVAVDVASVDGTNFITGAPNADFVRTSGEVRGYYPVYGDVVGMVKAQGGNVSSISGGGNDVRISDTFFKGGEFIRGFEQSGIGPRDVTPGFRNDALGGKTYLGLTGELQFPVPYVPEDLGLKAAFFIDAGTLYDVGSLPAAYTECTSTNTPAGCNYFDENSIRSSIGLSIIWQGSPLGPIRFDFGFPIAKEDYDETQVFRFSGGTAF